MRSFQTVSILAAAVTLGSVACHEAAPSSADTTTTPSGNNQPCTARDASLTLPTGFCASIFADAVGPARHIAVASNGDVFITLAGGSSAAIALRDVDHDGRADSTVRIGSGGGTGIALYSGYLYVDQGSSVTRYPLPSGAMSPSGASETVVSGLPTGGHDARNFAIDAQGNLFVNVGSPSNSCQQSDRAAGSLGKDPCPELSTRAGIWRFSATQTGQRFASTNRYATGVRNGEGLALNPADGSLWATQHGRDQLFDNWPKLFTAEYSAENPGEELMQINQNDDFGWPYCFYAMDKQKLVLAPEYGGDGTKTLRCDQMKAPAAAMPGHWAPMSLLFYNGAAFPAKYRNGAFIAFHGSWNRAPQPQAGFRLVFVPLSGGKQNGNYETFADGFAGGKLDPNTAAHRPMGLAQGPKGEMYVSDDAHGRVWKITYVP